MENNNIVLDLGNPSSPHMLIGGSSGSGKSELIKSIICSIPQKFNDPKDLQYVFIDPKSVELSQFKNDKLVLSYSNDYQSAVDVLTKLVMLMETRYKEMDKRKVNNMEDYRKLKRTPYVVVVIDELADLMLNDKKKEFTIPLIRLLQKARAAGIHIIACTQRPSSDVISGLLKNNMPVRIALKVVSRHDSRTILDIDGAEHLIGMGDMLLHHNNRLTRIQGLLTKAD
jgi:S-DNA-T family DNA segregation ATPase FtsK/SpoIIIE